MAEKIDLRKESELLLAAGCSVVGDYRYPDAHERFLRDLLSRWTLELAREQESKAGVPVFGDPRIWAAHWLERKAEEVKNG